VQALVAQPRITRRCAQDLRSLPAGVAEAVVRKFIADRAIAPEAAERIRGLTERPCYSLHSGRYRAATWFDQERDVVWLLGAGVHRADSPEDFYSVAGQRERSGQFYPTPADYAALEVAEQTDRLRASVRQLRSLRQAALAAPDAGRHRFTSGDGLYAELWAEAIPGLATVSLRLRAARLNGPFLADAEVAVIVSGTLGTDCVEKPDPDDAGYLFRYFEEDIQF
jgi:hypothetical protein